MNKICPACNKEFALSEDQIKKTKYVFGYKAVCSQKCKIARIREGVFNRRAQ